MWFRLVGWSKRQNLTFTASDTPAGNNASSKYDLNDAHDEFLRRENREQERQERRGGGGRETRDVLDSEWDRPHLAYDRIAVAKISERLNIARSEQFLGRSSIAQHPFLFEGLDVALSKQAVFGQSLSFCASHPDVNITRGPRMAKTKKAIKPPICNLKDGKLSPL